MLEINILRFFFEQHADLRFSYSFGHNLLGYVGSFNTPSDRNFESVGFGYGFESNISYHVNKWIGLETGLLLFAGFDSGILRVTFIPPIALNVIVRLPKTLKFEK